MNYNSDNSDDLLEKYILGLLSNEEKSELEKELNTNQELNNELLFLKELKAAVEQLEYEEAENKIMSFKKMMDEEKDEELIKKYILNNLTAAEKSDFDKRLKDDNKLKEKLQFSKELSYALNEMEFKSAENKIKIFDKKLFWRKNRNRRIKIIGIAAILLVLVGIFSIYFNQKEKIQFVNNFKPEKEILNLIHPVNWQTGNGMNTKNYYTDSLVINAFTKENYNEILHFFNENKINNNIYNNSLNYFILGLSYFKENNYLKAIPLFLHSIDQIGENHKTNLDRKLYLNCNWYLALSYFKTNNKEKAKFYLNNILNYDRVDQQIISNAKKLLNHL